MIFPLRIERGALPRDLVLAARAAVMAELARCQCGLADPKVAATVALQGGFPLTDVQPFPEIARLLRPFVRTLVPGAVVRLSSSSARLQVPSGEDKRLGWHQDAVPMQMGTKEQGVVAWLPLDPIDGTRPTLQVCEPLRTVVRHAADKRQFSVATDPQVQPVCKVLEEMAVGDVALFSPFAMHRTYTDEHMTQPRLSLDIRFKAGW